MNNQNDKTVNKIIRERIDRISHKSFDQKLEEIKHKLCASKIAVDSAGNDWASDLIMDNGQKSGQKTASPKKDSIIKLLSLAAGVFLALVFGGILLHFYEGNPNINNNVIRDADIRLIEINSNALITSGFFVPNINELDNMTVSLGEHRGTGEEVLFAVEGDHAAGRVKMRIVIHNSHIPDDNAHFVQGDIITVAGRDIRMSSYGQNNGKQLYRFLFLEGTARYFINLTAEHRGQYEQFLYSFL